MTDYEVATNEETLSFTQTPVNTILHFTNDEGNQVGSVVVTPEGQIDFTGDSTGSAEVFFNALEFYGTNVMGTLRSLTNKNKMLIEMFFPKKVAETPREDFPMGRHLTWDKKEGRWVSHISTSVALGEPDNYPYWMPMPPNPEGT